MSGISSTSKAIETDPSLRRGELDICPVCGSNVHPQAYFCSRCSNYFCYVCRSRVGTTDVSLQCVNRDCEYFGKLVCNHCNPSQTVAEKPFFYKEPTDGYWPVWLFACVVIGIYVALRTTLLAGGLAFISLYAGLGYLMQAVGFNIFGKERSVELHRSSTNYSCVRCSQPAKIISLSKKS